MVVRQEGDEFRAKVRQIDDMVDEGHEGNSKLPLSEYLGMNDKQYKTYIGATD